MRRSFHIRTAQRGHSWLWLHRILLAVLLAGIAYQAAPSAGRATPLRQETASGWSEAQTTHFQISVQSVAPNAAAEFAAAYGGKLETAYRELTLLFPIADPIERIPLFAYADQAMFDEAVLRLGRAEIPGITVFAGKPTSEIALFQPSFARYSAVEAENQLRHAVSHVVTNIASGGRIPWGFDEGIAQYVERPVIEKMARTASIVQSAYTRGELAPWFELYRTRSEIDLSLGAAQAYAVIAHLIDSSGLPKLRQLLAGLAATDDFREAFRQAYSGDVDDFEARWKEKVPEWTSGAWRNNLVAAFDLEPAGRTLEQANFAAAKEQLTPSLQLFEQIGDQEQHAVVQAMIAQCDIGIQAESLMTQAQQALETFTYDRALNLITQARLQFEQLPEPLRPTELLTQYEQLANQGISAKSELDSAVRLSHSWRDYADARKSARNAGVAFAALGDEANVALAQAELDRLDQRQRRIVLLLIALAVLTLVWLGLWLWARGPSELNWR